MPKKIKWPIKFPHISRRIPELPRLKFVVWGLAFIILLLNLFFALVPPSSEEMKLKQDVTREPFSSLFHQKLAQHYLNLNLEEAEKEFFLAENYFREEQDNSSSSNLLGVESSPLATLNSLLTYRQNLVEEIKYWEEFNKKYPQYEYGQLKLAAAYYRLGEEDNAKIILRKLLFQNPTFSLPLKLQPLFSPQEE